MGAVYLCICGWAGTVDAARLELRGLNAGPGGEIRIPLGQKATLDVWMDGQGERIRTLNLFLRYDPLVLKPLDVDPDKDGINPFITRNYMPQPSEGLNGVLHEEGELIYGVTNVGNAAASGAGVVASFQVEVIGPGPATEVAVDFRYPLSFTSYEIMNEQGGLEKRDFQPALVKNLQVLIGAGLIVADIPDLIMPGGDRDRSILLDEYVVDAIYPDDRIAWEISGNQRVRAQIEFDRRVTIQTPDDWSGVETLTFTASSPDGLVGSDPMRVTVIGPPRLQEGLFGLPDIFLVEDSPHSDFDLDDFLVADPFNPPDQLSWFAAGQQEILVRIDPLTHQLILVPPADWSGRESILFTVSNRFGLADTASISVEVAPFNDPPRIGELAELSLLVGGELIGPPIGDLVEDVDDDLGALSIEVAGDGQTVAAEIRDGRIVLTGLALGQGSVQIEATDPRGARGSGILPVRVTSDQPQPPLIEGFPDVILTAGESFVLSLDIFVGDLDTPDSSLVWEATAAAPVTVEIDIQRRAWFSAPADFAGEVMVAFEVRDLEGNEDRVEVLVTVLERSGGEFALELPEEIGLVAGQQRVLALRDMLVDPEVVLEELSWQLAGLQQVNGGIDGEFLTLTAPETTEGIFEKLVVRAVDLSGNLGTGTTRIWVAAEAGGLVVKVPPLVELMGKEAVTLDLDALVFDLDHPRESLEWSVQSSPASLRVSIDPETHLATIRRSGTSGKPAILQEGEESVVEEIVFAVRDADGHTAELRVQVRLAPEEDDREWAVQLPDTSLTAGDILVLELDSFVEGIDPLLLDWQVLSSSPAELGATVDAQERTLELVAGGDFTGDAQVILAAADPESRTGTDTLNITVLIPALRIGSIAPLEMHAGEVDTTLVLDEYVEAGVPDRLAWSAGGAGFVGVEIDAGTRRVRVWAPEGTAGEDSLVFTARDRFGQTARAVVRVRVVEIWEIGAIADVYLLPGESSVLKLDEYVVRGRAELLTWSVGGEEEIGVEIDAGVRQARLQAPLVGPVEEELVFSALTPAEQQLEDTVRVVVLPPPLRLRPLPDLLMVSGETDSSLVLDGYVDSGPPEQVVWSVEGAENLQIDIDADSRRVRVRVPLTFIGEERVILAARLGEEIARVALLVVALEAPPAFQLGDIPDVSMLAGEVDTSLVLDDYLIRGDPAQVAWSVEGSQSLQVDIDADSRRVRLEAVESFAEETLIFTARLDDEVARDTVRVRLREAPLRLELASLPQLTVIQGGIDSSLVLDEYLVEGDMEAVSWSIRGGKLVKGIVDSSTRRVWLDAGEAQTGVEIFFVEAVQEGVRVSAVLRVVVKAINFGVLPLPQLEIRGLQREVSLSLDPFVQGDWNPEQIRWGVEPAEGLIVAVDGRTRVLRVEAIDGFTGRAQLVLVADPPEGANLRIGLTVDVSPAVEEPVVVAVLPELSVNAGTEVEALDLDDFVREEDPATLVWRVVGDGRVGLSIDSPTHLLTLQTPVEFSGQERRLLAVRRSQGTVETLVELMVEVIAVPLPPALSLPVQIDLPVGEKLTLDLHPLVEDPDTQDGDIVWSVGVEGSLDVEGGGATRYLELLAPAFSEDDIRLSLRATDPEGNQAEGSIRVHLVQVDRVGPGLSLEVSGHPAFAELLEISARADEPLAGRPVVEVAGERLAVEVAGEVYRAQYPVRQDGLLNVAVSGTDPSGNAGSAELLVAVQRLEQEGGTVFSPDGKVQVNIPEAARGGDQLALVYEAVEEGKSAYHVEITGADEPLPPMELIFREVDPETQDGLAVLRWDESAQAWEEQATFADDGLLHASVRISGRYRIGAAENGADDVAAISLAYPNPFNTEVGIRYRLPEAGVVRVEVYDLQGHRLRTLVNRFQREGPWTAVWDGMGADGAAAASGVYLYVIRSADQRRTGKMTLVR